MIYELGFSLGLITPGLHCDHQGLILCSKFHKNAAVDQVLPHHYPDHCLVPCGWANPKWLMLKAAVTLQLPRKAFPWLQVLHESKGFVLRPDAITQGVEWVMHAGRTLFYPLAVVTGKRKGLAFSYSYMNNLWRDTIHHLELGNLNWKNRTN